MPAASACSKSASKEVADTIKPIVVSASIDYGIGRLVVTASETIDLNPASNVNVSRFFFENIPGDSAIALNGAVLLGLSGDSKE